MTPAQLNTVQWPLRGPARSCPKQQLQRSSRQRRRAGRKRAVASLTSRCPPRAARCSAVVPAKLSSPLPPLCPCCSCCCCCCGGGGSSGCSTAAACASAAPSGQPWVPTGPPSGGASMPPAAPGLPRAVSGTYPASSSFSTMAAWPRSAASSAGVRPCRRRRRRRDVGARCRHRSCTLLPQQGLALACSWAPQHSAAQRRAHSRPGARLHPPPAPLPPGRGRPR